MTQASLFDAPLPRETKRGRVPRSSVLAYRERPRSQRAAWVTAALTEWAGRDDMPPTSAELSANLFGERDDLWTLQVRRGLSDALALGLVEHAGERPCAVSGRTCVTWRVVAR